jgi:3-hydroxyacyl-CoA dehydrogenase
MTTTPVVTLEKRDGIGSIVLNNPPVNALSHRLRVELCETLERAQADAEVQAIALCCDGRTFVAGADIKEFGKPPQAPDVPELVELVGAARKPIVAALHGSALGGGLELALACSFRVAAPGTKLGFPEVTLGILPGAGGTQRLPRLIGVRAALELVVGGAAVSAERAQALGLVDAVIPGDLRAGALAFARKLVADGQPVRKASDVTAALEDPHLLDEFERGVRERSRGLLAPLHCVRAIRAAVELPFSEGLQRERELFAELMGSSQARALRHVFFSEREVARVPDLPEGQATRPVERTAVVGAGVTGTGLAIRLADAGLPVILVDASRENLERGMDRVRRHYAAAVASERLRADEAELRRQRIDSTLSYPDLAGADFVFETAAEDTSAKRAAFTALDAVCKPSAVLATTTAYCDADHLAWSIGHPENVVGMAFAGPAESARLVEVARTRRSAPDAWATALKLARTLGKIAVPVTASLGFVGGRMQAQQLREAYFLLEEGALPEQVDRALEEFGFAEGPLSAADRAGFDTLATYRKLNEDRLLPRERTCNLIEKLCEHGRRGRQAGAGFYRYGAEGERRPDPEVEELLVAHSKARGIARRPISDDEIVERSLCALINEGAKILAEGVARRPLDVDIVWIHGHGFPAYRGGPLFYADELGIPHVHQTLLRLQRRLGPECWAPAPLIERLAAEKKGFYSTA